MKLAIVILIAALLSLVSGVKISLARIEWHNWERMVRSCEAPGSDINWREGGWWANTGNSFYYGPQFTYSTWRSSGGPRLPQASLEGRSALPHYSKSFIIKIAESAYRSQGPGAWPNCHEYL